jgi:hypothetical protein
MNPFLRPATLVLSAVTLATLVACGGGGGDTSGTTPAATASAVTLQTYITDNLATEYSKVWVTIRRITALDASGTEVTLLDASAEPVVVNLSSLAEVGQLMSSVSVPAGLYTQVTVTLGNAVQLVSLDGATTTAAKFAASGDEFVWRVRGVEVDAATDGQLVLDFNLARFTYSASTGLVTPEVLVPKPADAFRKFVRQQAGLHATVTAVDATAGTLTVSDRHLGSGIVVALASDATIVNASTGAALTLADVAAGARLRIQGTVTPGATTDDPVTVTATLIQVEPALATTAAVRGAGTVQSVDGTKVTVALTEASFLPGAASVVVDVGSARFAHGTAADLVAGVTVSFRGAISGSGADALVAASVIDVDGAAATGKTTAAALSGLRGTVAQLHSDGTFTVTVSGAAGQPWSVAAGTYTVDAASATYRAGTATCLVAGATVKAMGTLSGTTLTARRLEVEGCAGQQHAAQRRH